MPSRSPNAHCWLFAASATRKRLIVQSKIAINNETKFHEVIDVSGFSTFLGMPTSAFTGSAVGGRASGDLRVRSQRTIVAEAISFGINRRDTVNSAAPILALENFDLRSSSRIAFRKLVSASREATSSTFTTLPAASNFILTTRLPMRLGF